MIDSPLRTQAAHRRGVLLLLAAAVLWSLNGVLIKRLQTGGVEACSIAAYRSLLAAVALAPLAIRRWHRIPEKRWMVGTMLVFTAMCASFVMATTMTSAANAILLQYTAPAWVFALSPLIVGETARRAQWVALAGAMAGVAIIFGGQFTTDAPGLLVGLAAGVIFGVQTVLFRRVRAVQPVVLAFGCCAVSGLLLLPVAALVDSGPPPSRELALLAVMGVVQFALPYVLYAAAAARVPAQEAVLILMLEPVLNPVWVWLGHGEAPAPGTIVGGVVILTSVMYLALAGAGHAASER